KARIFSHPVTSLSKSLVSRIPGAVQFMHFPLFRQMMQHPLSRNAFHTAAESGETAKAKTLCIAWKSNFCVKNPCWLMKNGLLSITRPGVILSY
ncbi:hypothetical protein, partial [Martelella alba]|uniref:hypothetical protein n=1 Tax=Martelella alba TaxID=2590451 RepID=UPI001E53AE5D